MPQKVTKSPTVETLRETKSYPPSKANSQFFYKEWRDLNEEEKLFVVWQPSPEKVHVGQVLGFLNFEHAVVEILCESTTKLIFIVDLTQPNLVLSESRSRAIEHFVKIRNQLHGDLPF